jgi:YD repeat-containing protein
MGNLVREVDKLGRVTTYDYNSIQRPTKITNAAGDSVHMTYSYDGRLLTEQDALGRTRT